MSDVTSADPVIGSCDASPAAAMSQVRIPCALVSAERTTSVALPNGRKALLVEIDGHVQAYSDICPHMGADLAQGRYDPKTRQLHCPWHGYVYDAGTGVMTENPNVEIMRSIRIASATFNPDKAICYRLRRFTVTRDGDHWVIASPESAP